MSSRVFSLLFVILVVEPLNARPNHKISSDNYNLLDDLPPDVHRTKRYVLNKRWPRNVLTWTLHKDNINPADEFIVRNTLHRGFMEWAEVSSLRFIELPVESKIPSDINVSFLKGQHNDHLPFDGPQGIVAHAYYPNAGILHFDADENWTLNSLDGINLYQVAVHEIGIGHSGNPRSIMYPQNKKFDRHYGLADDDVRGIRRLYPPTKQQLPTKIRD